VKNHKTVAFTINLKYKPFGTSHSVRTTDAFLPPVEAMVSTCRPMNNNRPGLVMFNFDEESTNFTIPIKGFENGSTMAVLYCI
jgi:hypothetical protein